MADPIDPPLDDDAPEAAESDLDLAPSDGAAPPPPPRAALDPRPGELGAGPSPRRGAVLGVPIDVVVSVGRARPLVSELVELRRDSVLPLDSRIDDPVEIMIGDRLIARGELQEMDDDSGRLAVRLTDVADLSGGV
jgi:flagellar motor switch protein FliN/FliY